MRMALLSSCSVLTALISAPPARCFNLAGSGHLAVGMARLGAHVTATACSPEYDQSAWRALSLWVPHLMQQPSTPIGKEPIHTGDPMGGSVKLRVLNWGEHAITLPDEGLGEFDVVLLSELTCLGEELQVKLLKTLYRVLGPSTVAYSICGDHGAFSLGLLWLISNDPSFVVEDIDVIDRLSLEEDETLYMHKITHFCGFDNIFDERLIAA